MKTKIILVLYYVIIKSQNAELFIVTPNSVDECMEVTLEQGHVRGFLSEDQRRCSFLGIPYASVPTGKNRFKAPEPPRSWTGTFDATESIMCTQILYEDNNNYVGVDDCLVVNIFMPVGTQPDHVLPVLASIHGGGYILGAGDNLQGNRILDQNIIMVTFNYRLGAFGFMCLGTEEVPGNAGLKDQVAALKWVKNNIANFGGNPDDVTLYGGSAGSSSAELLSLSKATEGLFNKIILESGSAIASWAVSYDPISAAKIIANIMGHRNAEDLNIDELVEIYTSATTYQLVTSVYQYFDNSVQPFLLSPCIESYIDEASVLSDSPMNILRSGNYIPVPTIVAYMDKEGLMFIPYWYNGWNIVFEERFSDFLLPILTFETESEKNEVAENIKQFYQERTEDDLHAFIDFQTDMYFFESLVTTAQMRARNSAPVYLMEFSYYDSTDHFSGAGHSALYSHVFEMRHLSESGGELTADRATNIFGNFVKYGNPVPSTSELLPVSWPKVTPTAVNYLSFGEELTVGQSPLPERYQFWSDIIDKYYNELPVPETPDSVDECMEVTLEQGHVRGFLSEDQRRCSFLGIPYASVPTGKNRFKAPEPPRSWTGTFDATESIMCTQILYHNNNNYVGVDDCLVVNIFMPVRTQPDHALPVLAFIHGGGYILGAGDNLQGNRILDQNIIMVTFNYRLGAFGFMCLGTEEVPGNAGLKDQVAALKWVKNNIANFGGNPDDVTLYGSSGGSSSVELLSLSKATEGLFNKIILESGSAIASWAVSYDPISAAKIIANIMGHRNAEDLNIDELVEIYTSATTYQLVTSVYQYFNNSVQPFLLSPCIESYIDEASVLSDSPMNILRSGNYIPMPTIVAYMDKEGLMFIPNWNNGWNTVFEERFSDFLLPILAFETESEKNEVAENIKQFYQERTEDDLHAFIDFQTDMYFFQSLVTTAQMRARNSAPVYLMEFSYYDSTNEFSGAEHSDLYLHVFEFRHLSESGGGLTADRATNLFGNFVKYGNPVPSTSELLPVSWPSVTPTAVNYLSFGEELTVGQSPLPERYQFWSDIIDKYYNELPVPETPDSVDECMEVTLEQGHVRGFLSEDQRRCSFLGIPYASVPTGKNRFKAPEPPRSWTGTFDATESIMCTQILYEDNNNYVGVDDCLVVNIFMPVGTQPDHVLPVLASIHGGGYILGAGDNLQGNRILDQNIIMVTFNYRLGAFGFMCLGTEEVPGNAGLKDQVAALKWVKNNIANFGGNPDDVTLYGGSAGSSSAELLSLSKATEGLFNKIILESGSAIASWAVSYDPISAAKIIANIMGHRNAEDLNIDELVEIYTSATTYEIVSSVYQYFDNSVQPFLLSPCIESYIDEASVLSDSPMNILRSGNYIPVPTIVAYMDKEGLMFIPYWYNGWNTVFEERFSDFLLPILTFETESEKNEVAENIKQFYQERTEDDLHAFIDFQTDMYFFESLVTTAQMRARNSAPVYLMEFSYYDSTDHFRGAGHSALYSHVFEMRHLSEPGGELTADRATNIFGNFVKYGNPVPSTSELLPVSWPSVTPTAVNYLSFGEELTVGQSPLPERYQFWSDIIDKYYNELPVPETPDSVDECMEVTLEQGHVRGFLSEDQRRCSFLGIPYASVPTGKNRFKAPEPPRSWTGTFDATESIMCTQILYHNNNNYVGVDDCLVVNIFMPVRTQPDHALPVLAFIHGGGYILGAGDNLQGNRILDQNIIMVTFNYRLGAFGFMCLGTEEVPGNAGLKDQVAALKWVKNNIANFGGNPDDVTLYGSSGGSSSAELLSLSKATEGLFNKIILESGSAIASWAVSYDPISAAKIIANIMGHRNAEDLNIDELVEIYTSATTYQLVTSVYQYFNNSVQPFLLSPCIESYIDEASVLSDSPMNILRSGNYITMPTIVAYMDKEGLMFIPNWNNGWNTVFEERFSDFLLPILAFETESEKNEVAENIKQFYQERTEDDLHAFIDFQTDMYFFESLVTTAQMRARNSAPVYLMEFSYYDSTNEFSGAEHSELYLHVFEIRHLSESGGELTADRATNLFGNFVKYGNPVPSTSELLPVSWPSVTPTAVNYLSFGEELTVGQSPLPERYQFWSDIIDKHYAMPQPSGTFRLAGSILTITFLSILIFITL